MNKRIILAGGSGFLGISLAKKLNEMNYDPVILSRNPENYTGEGRAVKWDGKTVGDTWLNELDDAAAIINLTGKNVNCRPTKKNREIILQSRTDSVRTLGEAIRKVRKCPPIWIQTGSLAIYGNGGDKIIDEAGKVIDTYPANVCIEWEAELGRALRPEMRWVNLRIGFVIGRTGGALPFLETLTRIGLGGSIGNGKQYISWIIIDDMIRLFIKAIENPEMTGTYNATGPTPVTNAEFMTAMRKILNRPWAPPAPGFAVKFGAPLLNSDPEIALTGRRCIPARLENENFTFHYTELEHALNHLYRNETHT